METAWRSVGASGRPACRWRAGRRIVVGRSRRHRVGQELQAVARRGAATRRAACQRVLRHADDEAAVRPRHEVGMISVHQRVAATRCEQAAARPSSTAPTAARRRRSPGRRPSSRRPSSTATQRPSRNRGCIGFSAWYRRTIGAAAPGSALHPSAVRNSGASPSRAARARARCTAVAEHGHEWYPPWWARFWSKELPNRYVWLDVARHGEAVDRVHAGGWCRAEQRARQRRRVVRRQPRAQRHPAQPVGRTRVSGLDHLGPEDGRAGRR